MSGVHCPHCVGPARIKSSFTSLSRAHISAKTRQSTLIQSSLIQHQIVLTNGNQPPKSTIIIIISWEIQKKKARKSSWKLIWSVLGRDLILPSSLHPDSSFVEICPTVFVSSCRRNQPTSKQTDQMSQMLTLTCSQCLRYYADVQQVKLIQCSSY